MKTMRLLFPLLALLVLSGWFFKQDDSVLKKALEDIKAPLTQIDKRYGLYETALNSAAAYLDAPSAETLETAKKTCAETMVSISELPTIESALTPEERGQFIRLGINTVDYDVPFQYAETYEYANLRTLTLIFNYFDYSPHLDEELRDVVDYHLRFHANNRKIICLGINHLFCEFTDGELDDFRTEFLPGLANLSADKLPWETDKTVIEAKTEYWLTKTEQDLSGHMDFIGERYLLFLKVRDDYKTDLIENGCTPEEAEVIIAALLEAEQNQETEANGF